MTGQGLVSEATRAVLAVAAELPNVSRVEIRCNERNHPSAAVPRRLGFSLESTVPPGPESRLAGFRFGSQYSRSHDDTTRRDQTARCRRRRTDHSQLHPAPSGAAHCRGAASGAVGLPGEPGDGATHASRDRRCAAAGDSVHGRARARRVCTLRRRRAPIRRRSRAFGLATSS
jgi:hypothetical protein